MDHLISLMLLDSSEKLLNSAHAISRSCSYMSANAASINWGDFNDPEYSSLFLKEERKLKKASAEFYREARKALGM
jgi:hypothetical protein